MGEEKGRLSAVMDISLLAASTSRLIGKPCGKVAQGKILSHRRLPAKLTLVFGLDILFAQQQVRLSMRPSQITASKSVNWPVG